ncbi:MAG: ABC transporter permease [Brevibacterium sp.]|uniref:ABC transporter permease n=1 Tax=unclassified Brevibacterium TaxID=2614124 RepID=UPI001E28A297|nr:MULTISPECIES: ABC transporter permease [unclassified Brevibacterium]MCD1286162.1 peptide ABC transporter [Brevibacterium sp. CCUG 69071]MDK8433521.1 ABC transporter permease [Brevibacterium sp. H-BE7]
MTRFVLTKIFHAIITFVLSGIVIFFGVRLLPGDPALAMAGEEATPERLDAIRADLGLDQPLLVQFFKFLGSILTGDLGESTRTGLAVTEMIATTLPVTLWLSLYAIVVAVVVGIALGMVAERFRGRWPEFGSNFVALLGLSVPNFWLGLLAILGLAVGLGWFPASGYVDVLSDPIRGIYYLTLPAVILGTSLAAVITRQTRASMIESMGTDYVRMARAKGLSRPRVLFRYGLRNSLIVLVTIVGLQLGGLISGAVVTERIFALPGLGKLTLDAVFSRDYPVIQAVVLVITASYILINLAVDILYSVINPQIRVSEDAS